tara:strand:- start:329 stop:1015 length:687 start_codon:yes stop_codon:yes gene_type:complete
LISNIIKYKKQKMLKTQEPQILEESKEYPVLATVNGIQIVKYTEKSVAAIGETKAFKDAIKEVGGKWNSKLKCGPGWILSTKKLEALKTALSTTSTDTSPTLVRKVVRRKKVKVAALTLVKNEVVKVLHVEPSVSQLTRIETKLDMILTLLGTMGVTLPVPPIPTKPVDQPPIPTKPVDVVEPVVKKTRKKIVKRRKKIKKSDQVPHPATTKTTEHVDQKPRKKLLGK